MKLIFVYNAEAGWLNAAWDSAHKLVSPGTYQCSLCAVTHHPLGMKKRWSRFIKELPCEVEFLHRSEAESRYAVTDSAWPQVLLEAGDQIRPWLSAEALAQAPSLDQLESLIRERMRDDTLLNKA